MILRTRKTLLYLILILLIISNGSIFSKSNEENVVNLSLKQAIELALKNNLDIKIDYHTVQQAEGSYIMSKALNDITFTASGSKDSAITVNTDVFGGGVDEIELVPGIGATTTDSDSWSIRSTIQERIPTGGTWTLSMFMTELDRESQFSTVNPYRLASMSFNISQPLLKGFGFSFDVPQSSIIISRNNLDISMETFKLRVMERLYDVIGSYWNLVAAQENLKVAEQSLEIAKDQLKQNRTQVEVGTMPPIEIVSAESGVAQAEATIISAVAAVKEAQDVLIQKLYAPEDPSMWSKNIIAVDEPKPEEIKTDLEEQMNLAFQNHPSIKSSEKGLENSELEVKASSWDLLPDITLEGSITSKGTGGDFLIFDNPNIFDPNRQVIGSNPIVFGDVFDQIFDRKFVDWTIGINVSFPLFNMSARGAHARSKAGEIISKVNLMKAKQGVIAGVRKAIRDLESNYLSIKANEKARILAEKQLEAERKKFEVGTSTNFQVLNYVMALANARTAEVRALIAYSLSVYNLQLQTGLLLEKNNISINPLEE